MIGLVCLHCKARRDYRPRAMRVSLHPHGAAILEFFCGSCYRDNRQEVSPDRGMALTEAGVPTRFVVTPAGELEEIPAPPPITETDVATVEEASLLDFTSAARMELGL